MTEDFKSRTFVGGRALNTPLEDVGLAGKTVTTTENLVCYGCAHSAAGVPYPSHPSGERPCLFCIRNPNQEKQLESVRKYFGGEVKFTARYDNGPTRKEVGDQYIATDRLRRDIPDDGSKVIT